MLADSFSLEFEWQLVFWTLLSILTDLNHAAVWMVSTCPLFPSLLVSLLMLYSRNTTIHGDISTDNDDFNKPTNTLYKNINLSHFIFESWCLLCVRDKLETETDCYIDLKFFFDHSSTSSPSWLGLINHGSQRAQSPLSAAGSHFGILSPTDSNRLSNWLYYCLTCTCFCCSSAYLHRCVSWLTARSKVNI